MAAHYVAFGSLEDMIAEVGAYDMGQEWFKDYGYTHCVMIVGDDQYDTEYCKSIEEARQLAREVADGNGIEVQRF